MQHDHIKFIGEMAESLGKKSFDDCFFKFYDEVLGIEHCTVFEYIDDDQTRIILAIGKESDDDNYARSLAYDYINGAFRQDPYVNDLMNSEKEVHPEWKKGNPQEIEDIEYRKKFYDKAELTHELILSYKDKQHSLIATLYRNEAQGAFSQDDEEQASLYIDLSLKLLNKHIELLYFGAQNNKGVFEKPYHRIFDILMQQGYLSPRETEICAMILVGYTTQGIALSLDISVNTVATHRKRAYHKLGIATQNELFCKCFEVLYDDPSAYIPGVKK